MLPSFSCCSIKASLFFLLLFSLALPSEEIGEEGALLQNLSSTAGINQTTAGAASNPETKDA
jgi:hypothetical protein